MQLVLSALLLGLALSGCEDPKAPDDTGEGEGEGEGEGDDLPSLLEDVDKAGCDGAYDSDGVFHEVPGAATYFLGTYENDGGVWTGEEGWYLFANAAWIDAGEGDCEVLYAAEATEADPGACPSCDLGLSVTLQVDVTLSDCPEELYEGTDGSVTYAIKYTSDTEATWYFASSGDELGSGYYNDEAMNFITDKKCMYF